MKIAVLGNPNTGKSSVFNMLTGLRQQVGNFTGVTVDKKTGKLKIGDQSVTLIDFPGTYSFYPRSKDEQVVYNNLCNKESEDFPDGLMVVVDASNLERNLLFFSQLYDLGLPTIMVLNMTDVARKQHKKINVDHLEKVFPEATIVETNARVKLGKESLLNALGQFKERQGHQFLSGKVADLDDHEAQENEAKSRFELIQKMLPEIQFIDSETTNNRKLDSILVHKVWGYVIFAAVLFTIFQFIFSFAQIPMDFIDGLFADLSAWTVTVMSPGLFADLLSQGIIPGIGGVVIFIPQIALLFFFIAILEETGYLSRVVFMMDRLMRPFGLNGKSVVPLMSSVACAIPGIMATRTIADWKERLITIMVAPLMSCSARIPVYTLLIALVIPEEYVFGFISLQGLVLLGLYLLGTVSAILVAALLNKLIKNRGKGFLLLEMPEYKSPRWGNVGILVWEKVRVFVWDAGRIIVAISIILWALASFGPGDRMQFAAEEAKIEGAELGLTEDEIGRNAASAELKNSYIGILGQSIEPVIRPLGYDWKIGISLITSFAAREVFVGSMATIYAVEDDGENNLPLIEKMRSARKEDGTPVYTLASGISLMVFYVFAMQCMATLAVVKRETKSWKWPLLQIGYMGVLAYVGALVSYMIAS